MLLKVKLRFHYIAFISCFFVTLLVAGALDAAPPRAMAWPALASPELLMRGQALEIRLAGKDTPPPVHVTLRRSFEQQVTMELDAPVKSESGALTYAVPDQAGPGMYDLCATFEISGKQRVECADHAVNLFPAEKTGFRFGVISDIHIGDPRTEESNPGIPVEELYEKGFKALEEAGVDFVIATGDITSYPMTYKRDYEQAYSLFAHKLHVPAFILPGNHDLFNWMGDLPGGQKGIIFWRDTFGPMHMAVTLGRKRFIGINTDNWTPHQHSEGVASKKPVPVSVERDINGLEEYDWLVRELDSAAAAGLEPVVFAHHAPDSLGDYRAMDGRAFSVAALMQKIRESGVRYFFHGHAHEAYIQDLDGLTLVCTGTFGSNIAPDTAWSARVVDLAPDGAMTMRLIDFWKPQAK